MKDHYNNHSGSVSNSRHPGSTRHLNHQPEKKSSTTKGKTEWRKTAIRICGDWSEQLSSKKKIYYYNCTTEVSQWQKPKEWTLPEVPRQQLIDLYTKRTDKEKDGQAIKRTHSSANCTDSKPVRPAGAGKGTGSSSDAISPKRTKYSSSDNLLVDTSHKGVSGSHSGNNYSSHSSSLTPANIRQQQNHGSGSSIPVISSSGHHHDNRQQQQHPYQYHSSTGSGQSQGGGVQHRLPPVLSHHHPNHDQSSGINKSRESMNRGHPHGPNFVLPPGMTISNDDMDISPNSSPMSGGSCSPTPPLASMYPSSQQLGGNKNNSPSRRRPLPGREGVQRAGGGPPGGNHAVQQQRAPLSANAFSANRAQGRTAPTVPPGETQNTLRQMMDNLRGTLTGLLSGKTTTPSSSNQQSRTISSQQTLAGRSQCLLQQPSTTSSGISHPGRQQQPGMTSASYAHSNMYSRSMSNPVPVSSPSAQQVNASVLTALSTALSSLCSSSGSTHTDSGGGGGGGLLSTRQVDELMAKLESVNNNRQLSSPPCGASSGSGQLRPQGPYRQQHSTPFDPARRGSAVTVPSNSNNRPYSSSGGGGENNTSPHQQAELMRLLHDVIAQAGLQSPAAATNQQAATNRDAMRALASLLQKGMDQLRGSISPSLNRDVNSSPAQSNDRSGLKPNPQSNGHGSEHCGFHPGFRQDERGNGISHSNSVLDSLEVMQFLDSTSLSRFRDPLGERLEQEAQTEAQKFDKLQTVLYGELSGELKKLRALVRISEVKTSIHQKKKEALDDLMDTIESRKCVPSYTINRTYN